MILLFAVWILTAILVIPYGYITSKLLHYLAKNTKVDNTSIVEYFFLGIVSITSIVGIINYFNPIDASVTFSLALIAIFILWIYRKNILEAINNSIHSFLFNLSFARLIISITIGCGILLYALSTPISYDMDLYHLQYMQWITEYKIIPGLGNLHGRFAFNSSFLLLSSLFYNAKSLFYIFPINELIAILVLVVILKNWKVRDSSVNCMCLLIFVLYLILFGNVISSTSTDFSVNFIVLYLFLYCYDHREKINSFNILYVFIISTFCITLKISSVFIILLPIFLFFRYKSITFNSRQIMSILCITLLIISPWLGRYIILSGYLIYPFDKIDIFSFDWKMPLEIVTQEKIDAYGWARIPFEKTETTMVMPVVKWFPIWFASIGISKQAIFSLAFLSPLFLIIIAFLKKINTVFFVSWSICFLGTIYLLFTAPDLRFASGFVLLCGFLPIIYFLSHSHRLKNIITPILGCAVFILSIYLCFIGYGQIKLYQPLTEKTYCQLIITPQPYGILTGHEMFNISKSNDTIFYPTLSNKCYDHYLPCSPYLNPNLHFRGDKIEDGFIIKEKK